MKTTKLYQQDVYLKEWTATVTSVLKTDDDSRLLITLDRTAFFPEGGGQSCDIGYINGFKVIDVQEDGDTVSHTISLRGGDGVSGGSSGANSANGGNDVKSGDGRDASADNEQTCPARQDMPAASGEPLSVGSSVTCSLDWGRRFDNMQRHCGEHILSGVFYSMFGGVNRGFHMGSDYMTIDISLEEDPSVSEITYDDAIRAEMKANEVIWSDAPVTVMRFDSREEAEKMPLRKALAFDEDISIVSVGSIENAADCVACCGTHPSSAGQVGLIKIYKVEKYKSMFRIYFDAGQRALKDYDRKHDILTELSNRYSSSVDEFPEKLKSQEEKLASLKDELFHIKKALTDIECAKLDGIIASADENIIIYRLTHFSMDDAFNMSKRYMGSCAKLVMLYAEKNTSFVLASDGTVNCGALVKEYASFYNGKGGGSDVSARAIFTCEQDAMLFADLISKHLR